MAPFFDPARCPICHAALPPRPLRCLTCGVALTGPIVVELVTALRRADSLVDHLRADLATSAVPQPQALLAMPGPAVPQPQALLAMPGPAVPQPQALLAMGGPAVPQAAPAPSWFAGKSVGVILLILGALCVLAASAVFVAVAWMLLPIAVRALILVAITAGFAGLAELALRRGLQATAEAMATIASGMLILDLAAARRAGLPGLADLADAPYEILAGVLLAAAAGAGAVKVRSRQGILWSLDVAVAVGLARAAIGALNISGGLSGASVTVTVLASLLYVLCRRLRLPVARWTALALAGMGWLVAVGVGTQRAADLTGNDLGRLAASWPALAVAVVAGVWSVRLTQTVWRRVAAGLCLLPPILVLEVIGWSHGWVLGSAVMLVGFAVAALASGRVPSVWTPAVGGSALLLGLSAVVGLLPTLVTLVGRMGLALLGSWPTGSANLPLDLLARDVGPWLLPVTALVLLALLPRITIDGQRLAMDQRCTAGVVAVTFGVLPMLYGADFWVSMAALVIVAVILLVAARLWQNDILLLLALAPLVIVRVCAYSDALADPLAWTLLAVVALAWGLPERRPELRAVFLTAAGLFALAGTADWLTYAQVPRGYHGLVIVALGSLGLLASQRLVGTAVVGAAVTRAVAEGLAVIWAVVGLTLGGRSPSHGALELTVIGVAAGITAYLSDDRRRSGWASGLLLTLASWIRLADKDIAAVEWYTLPAATALLLYGVRRLGHHPGESTWRCLGPGLALALTPSLFLALGQPLSWRGLLVGLAAVALVALGVQLRLAAPFALGVVATALLAVRNIWPVAAFLPRWTLLFLVGGILLGVGMTWEARVNQVRAAGGYVRGLR